MLTNAAYFAGVLVIHRKHRRHGKDSIRIRRRRSSIYSLHKYRSNFRTLGLTDCSHRLLDFAQQRSKTIHQANVANCGDVLKRHHSNLASKIDYGIPYWSHSRETTFSGHFDDAERHFTLQSQFQRFHITQCQISDVLHSRL